MIFFQKKGRLQNLQSSVGKQKMRECEALSFKSLIRKEGYLSNIPLFGDKTINLISRHLNLFTAISQQVLLSFYHQQRYTLEIFAALGSNGKKCDRNQRHKLPKKI